MSKSWLDIDRDELEVVLVVAVCPWLLLEFACLSEAILGSDAEFEADGWGFSVKNKLGNQNLVKLPILLKVNKNDGEQKNVCEQKFRKLCVNMWWTVYIKEVLGKANTLVQDCSVGAGARAELAAFTDTLMEPVQV